MNYKHIIFDLIGVLFEETNSAYGLQPLLPGIELLKKCKKTGYRLHLLTNASRKTIDMLTQLYPHVFSCFDSVITPNESGYKKPDTRMFNHLLTTQELDPTNCIFIDDSSDNITTAHALGIQAILYTENLDINKIKHHVNALNC